MNLIEHDVKEFVYRLSSKSPTPGGGGAAALTGALCIALGGMAVNLTIGKPQYQSEDDELSHLKISAYRVQSELLDLVQKDADAFGPLAGAYSMPSKTEEEKAEKKRVMEACLKDATEVPLKIMKLIAEAIGLLEELADKCNELAISDIGCGATLARSALEAGWLNVSINTSMMEDRKYAAMINKEGMAILTEYVTRADDLYQKVMSEYNK